MFVCPCVYVCVQLMRCPATEMADWMLENSDLPPPRIATEVHLGEAPVSVCSLLVQMCLFVCLFVLVILVYVCVYPIEYCGDAAAHGDIVPVVDPSAHDECL
jgi:hypothetical protein